MQFNNDTAASAVFGTGATVQHGSAPEPSVATSVSATAQHGSAPVVDAQERLRQVQEELNAWVGDDLPDEELEEAQPDPGGYYLTEAGPPVTVHEVLGNGSTAIVSTRGLFRAYLFRVDELTARVNGLEALLHAEREVTKMLTEQVADLLKRLKEKERVSPPTPAAPSVAVAPPPAYTPTMDVAAMREARAAELREALARLEGNASTVVPASTAPSRVEGGPSLSVALAPAPAPTAPWHASSTLPPPPPSSFASPPPLALPAAAQPMPGGLKETLELLKMMREFERPQRRTQQRRQAQPSQTVFSQSAPPPGWMAAPPQAAPAWPGPVAASWPGAPPSLPAQVPAPGPFWPAPPAAGGPPRPGGGPGAEWAPGVTWDQLVAHMKPKAQVDLLSDVRDALQGVVRVDFREMRPEIWQLAAGAAGQMKFYAPPEIRKRERRLPSNMITPEAAAARGGLVQLA